MTGRVDRRSRRAVRVTIRRIPNGPQSRHGRPSCESETSCPGCGPAPNAAARISPRHLGYNRLCHLGDSGNPRCGRPSGTVFAHEIGRFGPEFPSGVEYRKHWEVGMAVRTLADLGLLHDRAQVLGIGAGNEPTIFWLTNKVAGSSPPISIFRAASGELGPRVDARRSRPPLAGRLESAGWCAAHVVRPSVRGCQLRRRLLLQLDRALRHARRRAPGDGRDVSSVEAGRRPVALDGVPPGRPAAGFAGGVAVRRRRTQLDPAGRSALGAARPDRPVDRRGDLADRGPVPRGRRQHSAGTSTSSAR